MVLEQRLGRLLHAGRAFTDVYASDMAVWSGAAAAPQDTGEHLRIFCNICGWFPLLHHPRAWLVLALQFACQFH